MEMLIGALASNTINGAGHDLITIPNADLAATLREAAQWPLDPNPFTGRRDPTAA